jgi:hypothetical protein
MNHIELENSCGFIQPPPVKKYKKKGVDEACGLLRTVKHNLEKSGRLSICGEYVASRVRNLHNSRLQFSVQNSINTIRFNVKFELNNVQTHSEQTPLTVHLDSEASMHLILRAIYPQYAHHNLIPVPPLPVFRL